MTDQHNYRTLGCYREYLISKNLNEQAFVWGPGVEVKTPHIDRLANEGVLFTNFHSTVPLCTPNRGTFVSGLYPESTGANRNHEKMNDDVVTFAQLLRQLRGYHTSYLGKWHLNGRTRPGFGEESPFPDFGFSNIKYLFNQGHWKWIEEVNNKMKAYEYDMGKTKFAGKEDKHFLTDYLFDRGIEIMEQKRKKGKPFFTFLSIPDPHPPKEVRPPYDTMYDHFNFQLPYTARTAATLNPSTPGWNNHEHLNVPLDDTEEYLENYENDIFYQTSLRKYFGMVKCVDDNVGKLLSYLDSAGIDEDTIIVFTSDHGDMLSEHGKFNKNRPYRTSAGIPFMVRHPKGIKAGKIVETAYTSVDFAPTILNYLGATNHDVDFQGIDFSDELSSDEMVSAKDIVRYVFDSGNGKRWAAAIMKQYRLIISKNDLPWLFDLDRDPYEIKNYFDKTIRFVQRKLQNHLFDAIPRYKIPLQNNPRFSWSLPACFDSKDRLPIKAFNGTCKDLGTKASIRKMCKKKKVNRKCPVTCGTCCADSSGFMWESGDLISCDETGKRNPEYPNVRKCSKISYKDMCPVACNQCEADKNIFE
jgi:arylsulfatase A-like enzyme